MPVLLFVEKMKGYSSHFLCIVRKYFLSLDKAVEREYTCAKFRGTKPMTQTSRQNESLPESRRRWDGGREDFAEWTAEGGLNGVFSQ